MGECYLGRECLTVLFNTRRRYNIYWLAATLCFWSSLSVAETLKLAVASNFRGAMTPLLQEFDPKGKYDVRVSYGSSGKLFAQIVHGAPFDIFLSADSEKPAKLVEKQLASPQFQITYAVGRLVLWCPLNCKTEYVESTLREQKFSRLAMANPKLAPYGLAASETLNYLNVALDPRQIIRGDSIAQAYHFVASGAAPMGFIALSQVFNRPVPHGQIYWEVPQHMHSSIKQDALLLSQGERNSVALKFFEFLQKSNTQQLLRNLGYRQACEPRQKTEDSRPCVTGDLQEHDEGMGESIL